MNKLEHIINNEAPFKFISREVILRVSSYCLGYRLQEEVKNFDNKPFMSNSYFVKEENLIEAYDKRFLDLNEKKLKEWMVYE